VAENQEDRSGEDLTEEASPYRLEEYRRKGMVAQSRELSGLAALIATAVMTYSLGPSMGANMAEFMRDVFRTDLSSRLNLSGSGILSGYLIQALKITAAVTLPVAIAGFVIGAVGSFAQIGSIFSTEALSPDFSKIDPMKGFQRIFSKRIFTDLIRLVGKTIILSLVSWAALKPLVIRSPQHLLSDPFSLLTSYGETGRAVMLPLLLVLAVFGAIDFGQQRWEYMKNLRMTKQEAKQEFKEREGDPQIKARIRSVQREMARKRMMQAVKTADVIITNPTHIAIAISYDKEKMAAPRVVAKGADFVAQTIKKIAADAGVPMVENVPLARTLFKTVKLGHAIPRALYQAVAEVLAYVYRLKNMKL